MTVKQHPFVYVEDRPPTTGNCSDLNEKNKHYVQCTGEVFDSHDDHSKEHGVHCCSGIVCYLTNRFHFCVRLYCNRS